MRQAQKNAPFGALLLFVLNISLCLAVFFSGTHSNAASVMLLATSVIFAIGYSLSYLSQIPQPAIFMASVYIGYGFIIPGLYQVRNNDFFWPSRFLSNASLSGAATLCLITTTAFFVGHFFQSRKWRGIPFVPRPVSQTENKWNEYWSTWSAIILCGGVLLVSMAAFVYFGPDTFFGTRGTIADTALNHDLDLAQQGLMVTFPRNLATGSLLLSAYLFSISPKRNYRHVLALLLAIISNLLLNFPTSISRYSLLAMVFIILFTIFRDAYTKHFRSLFFIVPLMLYAVFPILGSYNRDVDISTEFVHPGISYLASGDLDGFQSTANAVQYVERNGLELGRVILSAMFFFVPRSVWNDKLEPSGTFVAAEANYSFLNISMPLNAELYLDGWYFLSIIGMFLVGRLTASADRKYQESDGRARFRNMFPIALAAFFPILLRGPLLGIVASFVVTVFFIALWRVLFSAFAGIGPPLHYRPRAHMPNQTIPIRKRTR